MKTCVIGVLACVLSVADAAGVEGLQRIRPDEIRLKGEIGRRIDLTVEGNLLKIEIEKQFLEHFRKKARRGDSVGTGKLIEYGVRFAVYTGDARVKALKSRVVDELLATQGEDGYIGCLKPGSRVWGYWDVCECGFIILGLSLDHRYFGETRSLEAAKRAADYILANWHTKPAGWEEAYISGQAAHVGLAWGFLELYRETQDRKYLDFCTKERWHDTWYRPITIGRDHGIYGHSATHLYQCLMQGELAGFGVKVDGRATKETAAFMLDGNGTAVSGGCGLWECWTDDQCGRPSQGETCSTSYQMRFWDMLLRTSSERDARWGDAIERTLYNQFFGAQSKDGRKIRYYTTLEGDRTYYPSDTYCCPNNFRRQMAELPEYVVYRTGGGLLVNLYESFDLKTKLASGTALALAARTDYPTGEKVVFTVDPAREEAFALTLRLPGWCEKPALAVNGEAQEVRPGTYATLSRTWKKGDVVTLSLPMRVRAVLGRRRQSGRVAFLRGPILYALDPEINLGAPVERRKLETFEETAEDQKALALARVLTLDPADFCGQMMLDVASARVVPDASNRPDGTALLVRAATVGHAVGVTKENSTDIRLTEFAGAGCKATYFRVPDLSVGERDGLFGGAN